MIPIAITGTGSFIPQRVITNDDLSKIVDTSDEWISTRTGIKERHIVAGETTSDMATAAAAQALATAGIKPEEVDLVVVATVTPDRFTPTVSCLVQKKLGLVKATCLDLWAGCSGFIFSLMTAHRLLASGSYQKALVIGAESLTKLTNWADRNTCVLFGDGAGAVAIESGDTNGILNHITGSDGSRGDVLVIEGVAINNPAFQSTEPAHHIIMDGGEVFKFAVNAMNESIRQVLNGTGFGLEEIDYFIPHQANDRIIELVAHKMKLPREKFYTNLHKYGNTSAASIPIALDEMNNKGMLKKGMKLITVGFGGGLTWGANLLQWVV
ncbi:MAG TPA: 3-oxoacyl-ACP synthase [Firmicutes bacterium]|jgi:3-oxoacyl-[acyl-carrier-protein] synthase-3|nr:3-oxoacyl-ACP synthase [Bacillota bacterium]HAW70656.1 3-oxoacyl-ACP synthase [Bacillota bacterium]HBE06538.1 3-oxoacyl-ACP synthase [Bacillota bacterium]HBG45012.1 3-oxoacyl-ACP synthase [Bacillota bacterium]HBL49661.1 3-oxoacyl-ACP synthase [Bacillota bacterium]